MRNYSWFVEHLDAHTNEVFFEIEKLEEIGEKRCEDEKNHFLWKCENYKILTFLRKSKKKFNLDFQVWTQEGNGKIRKWKF